MRPRVRIPRRGYEATLAAPLLLVLLVAGSPTPVPAQLPRTHFWVPNGTVEDLAIANGKVYLAGSFTQVGPATGAFVGFDATTGLALQPIPEVSGFVHAVVSDGADGWYIGGTFTSVRGLSRSNLAHIDAAGNLTGWNPGTNYNVSCLARDPSTGIVYVGGDFTTVGGQSRSGLAAVDGNGVVTPWNVGAMGGVNTVVLYEGTLYVGGTFVIAAGQTRNRAAAFDAATAALLPWNPDVNGSVIALAPVLTIGFPSTLAIYVGGGFTTVGGIARSNLASVDGTTGALKTWNPGANGAVGAIAITGIPNSVTNPLRIHVGGNFQVAGGASRSGIAQLTESGVATAWNPGAGGIVYALRASGSRLYVGGTFSSIGAQPFRNLAAVDLATGSAMSWEPLAGGTVRAFGVSSSAIFAGGDFWTVGGVRRNRLAAIDLGTGQPTGWNPDADAPAFTLVAGNEVVYAGGDFTTVGGLARSYVAALDPVTGVPTAWDPRANGRVQDLAIGSGVVYVAGSYTVIATLNRNGLAAIDAVTGLATNWDPAPSANVTGSGMVTAICPRGAKLYVGGDFTSIGGQARSHLAALDTNVGSATSWNPSVGPHPELGFVDIEEIALSGPNVFVGGIFGQVGSRYRSGLAVVDSVTGLANSWDLYMNDYGTAEAFVVDGQAIYVGGLFSNIGLELRNGIAVLDATTGLILPWNPRLLASVNAMQVHQGAVYAVGSFAGSHRTFAVFSNTVTGVPVSTASPPPASVHAAPNPFRADVGFRFALPRRGVFDIAVYDVNGRLIRRLASGPREAGEHRLSWDGKDEAGRSVASGVYLAQAEAEGLRLTAKVLKME